MDTLAHAYAGLCTNLWDGLSILNTDAKKILAFPMLETPTIVTLS